MSEKGFPYSYQYWSFYDNRWVDGVATFTKYKLVLEHCNLNWKRYRIFHDGKVIKEIVK